MNIICDIDGTVADGKYREHYVTTKPKNWPAYYNLLHTDTPIKPVVQLVTTLQECGSRIIFVSGRNGDYKEQTLEWLKQHFSFPIELYMRAIKDYRSDDIIKEEILDMLIKQGFTPDLILDDRQRVVDMWRRRGFVCLQPRPGDF